MGLLGQLFSENGDKWLGGCRAVGACRAAPVSSQEARIQSMETPGLRAPEPLDHCVAESVPGTPFLPVF